MDLDQAILLQTCKFLTLLPKVFNIIDGTHSISRKRKNDDSSANTNEKSPRFDCFKDNFDENFHIDSVSFEKLYSLLKSNLLKSQPTRLDDEITLKEKLACVLDYFECGSLQRDIASLYRISTDNFGIILDQVCDAICAALKKEIPTLDLEKLEEISHVFEDKWNFPNCVGAVDGKYCELKCPKNTAYRSIGIMAVADADYKFICLDVGAFESKDDANSFARWPLKNNILNSEFNFGRTVNIFDDKLPYCFVGDDAFPLHTHIMKPFVATNGIYLDANQSVYNYRLSRAKQCIDNAFGVLCSRFFCLSKSIQCEPERARKIIYACCYLHNYFMRTNKEKYCPSKYADFYNDVGETVKGDYHKNVQQDSLFHTDLCAYDDEETTSEDAEYIRNKLKDYVNSEDGSIPFQKLVSNVE